MGALSVDLIPSAEMTPGMAEMWQAVQAAHRDWQSPFFSLGYLHAVAASRGDVRVAVLSDSKGITGFLPFHLRPGGRGAPLGGPITDYQGILGEAPEGASVTEVLRQCGLSCYDYDHALRRASFFRKNAFRESVSPLINLSEGFEGWRADRQRAGSALKTLERKIRKMERDVGPLRFVANDPDDDAWQSFLIWKRAALRALGVRFVLDRPWAASVIERIRSTQTPAFSGLFSTLYAGDRLVAAHFGMRSATTWHWWFPSYDTEMSAYTPGLALLFECARHGAEMDVMEIDLGRGSERYKREFSTDARELCEGSLERPLSPQGAARRFRKVLHRAVDGRLSEELVDFKRRAFNRLLGSGRI